MDNILKRFVKGDARVEEIHMLDVRRGCDGCQPSRTPPPRSATRSLGTVTVNLTGGLHHRS